MIDYFEKFHRGDRDGSVQHMAQRLGLLIATADLSSINKAQFVLLSQVLNGLATENICDGKAVLVGAVSSALEEQEEFRLDIADRHFPGDTSESRATFTRELDDERERLRALQATIENLEDSAALALLYRIEEVYAGADDLRASAEAVYRKIETRDRL